MRTRSSGYRLARPADEEGAVLEGALVAAVLELPIAVEGRGPFRDTWDSRYQIRSSRNYMPDISLFPFLTNRSYTSYKSKCQILTSTNAAIETSVVVPGAPWPP